LRVQGSGFRVQGSGFRVQGSGCRVQGAGVAPAPRAQAGPCCCWSSMSPRSSRHPPRNPNPLEPAVREDHLPRKPNPPRTALTPIATPDSVHIRQVGGQNKPELDKLVSLNRLEAYAAMVREQHLLGLACLVWRGVWGVGCGVWDVGGGVWGVGCGVWDVGGGVWGVGCGVWPNPPRSALTPIATPADIERLRKTWPIQREMFSQIQRICTRT